MNAVLEIADVSSGYGSSMVVHNTTLRIAPGEIVALVGKNGMGKSSLLKTVLGFLPARSGSIKLLGQDVTTLAPHFRRRLAVANAPQEQALFQDLSVRENLRLGLMDDAGFEQRLAMVARWFP